MVIDGGVPFNLRYKIPVISSVVRIPHSRLMTMA